MMEGVNPKKCDVRKLQESKEKNKNMRENLRENRRNREEGNVEENWKRIEKVIK
jgi:hypothetical protein